VQNLVANESQLHSIRSPVNSKKNPKRTKIESTCRKGAFATAAVATSLLSAGDCARAQAPARTPAPSPVPAAAPESTASQLPEVLVTAEEPGYAADSLSLSKFTQPLLTTPRSASVVTSQLMQDQNLSTLRDALRNVSGISIGAGEGSYQGDNFSIRGFPAQSDIYIDGMNDSIGSYNRDPFNIERVEVLKGPSSAEFGRGSSGGVVNEVSKTPKLEAFIAGSVSYGTDNTIRETLDINEPISILPGAAFRLNLMDHNADVTGRGDARLERWGIAPSVAFGIGTPTRLNINFMHETEDNTPDFGIPWLNDRPAPVSGDDSYFGFKNDFTKTDTNIGTIRLEHDFNDTFTLREQFRGAVYERDFRISEPQVVGNATTPSQLDAAAAAEAANPSEAYVVPGTPLSQIQVARNIIDGKGVSNLFDQDLSLLSKFDTGPFSHTLITGFEYVHQSDNSTRVEPGWENVPSTSLLEPTNPAFPGFGSISTATDVRVDTLSAYVTDTMKLNKQWSLIGGGRFDYVSSHYYESIPPTQSIRENVGLFSWRAAVVYQPRPEGSIYLSAGTSVHPNITQLALSSETTLPANTVREAGISSNREVELGTKWELLEKRFSFTSAAFWDEETNPAPIDLDDPLFTGTVRVVGWELGMVGHITDKWQVTAGYTLQYSRVLSSNVRGMIGNPALNAPKDIFTAWTTYDLPLNFQIGFGTNMLTTRTATYAQDTNGRLEQAPGYVIFNAMLKYHITKDVDLQVNVNNLTNKFFYDGVHPGHVVPGEGREGLFSLHFKF